MKINCPHCGQKLVVTDEMSGKIVQCPSCDKGLTLSQTANGLPALSDNFEKMPAAIGQDYLPCKFCGELIKNEAIKCRHCGEFLNVPTSPVPPSAQSTPKSVHNIQVNIENTNTNTNGCLGSGCGSGCGWLSIILVAVVIILIIAGQCSDNRPPVIPDHSVKKTTETKIAPVTVNQPTATIQDLKTISMPPAPVKLTQQQRRLKLMEDEPFKPAVVGDKVKFTIDEKTKISGKLVEITDRGIKVEAAEGVTVLYRRERINESDLVQFYRSDYERYISSKLPQALPGE
jgi:ribosomal protein S27E